MPSATEAAARRGGASNNLLRGSDLPEKVMSVTIRITEAREAPANFNSPIILEFEDIKEAPGRTALPLNKTNTGILAQFLGDDYSHWAGATIQLQKTRQRNPQNNTLTWGLAVLEAKPYSEKVKSKLKPGRKPAKPGRVVPGSIKDDDIPF